MTTPKKNTEQQTEYIRQNALVLLVGCNYLSNEKYEEARQRLEAAETPPYKNNSVQGTLKWLLAEHYTDRKTVEQATLTMLETDSTHLDGWLTLITLLKEIDPRFEQKIDTLRRQQRKKAKQQLIIMAVVAVAAVAGGAYLFTPSSSTPSCSSSAALSGLRSIMVEARLSDMSRRLDIANDSSSFGTTAHHSEVGYDKENRSRGCIADLSIGKDTSKIGYVIRPTQPDKNDFEIQMYSADYVTARYNEQGMNKNLGAPLGRAAIQETFMTAIKQFDDDVSRIAPSYTHPKSGEDQAPTMSNNISGVMPTADCKEIDANHYSCPLLIDYQDKLLSAIGAASTLQLKGDFVFIKENNQWKMAGDFKETFTQAIVKSRVGAVFGTQAADKMDSPPAASSDENNSAQSPATSGQ